VSGADLAAEPWIAIPPDNVAGSFAAEAFRASGLGLPRPTVVTFSQNLRYHLLAGGRYLTTLAGSALRFNAEYFSLKVLPVKLNFPPRPVVVVTLKNRSPSPLAKIFVEHAHAVAKSMAVQ
jgi:DNA-binding transcriptional LysR family regulator